MRNLDSCRCWRCTLCPCRARNKFLVNFWNCSLLLCISCIHVIWSAVNHGFREVQEQRMWFILTGICQLLACLVLLLLKWHKEKHRSFIEDKGKAVHLEVNVKKNIGMSVIGRQNVEDNHNIIIVSQLRLCQSYEEITSTNQSFIVEEFQNLLQLAGVRCLSV